MSRMELFDTLVNGLSILGKCRQELRPRGCEGPGSGSENKCGNNLFISIIFQVCLRILSTFKSMLDFYIYFFIFI